MDDGSELSRCALTELVWIWSVRLSSRDSRSIVQGLVLHRYIHLAGAKTLL